MIILRHLAPIAVILSGSCLAQVKFSGSNLGIPLSRDKAIIAKVADREITYKDFIERAEYTLRPSYCKGSSNNDKNIVINTLIAEKILAIETEGNNELIKDENFQNFILGRREQKMRELLYFYEAANKVSLDPGDIKNIYETAGRTYKIQYFNLKDKVVADSVAIQLAGNDSTLGLMSSSLPDSITDGTYAESGEREISWSSPESDIIHNALFSGNLLKNQVVGPISIADTTHLIIKINGWTDRLAITDTDIRRRWSDVKERLTAAKADSIYNEFTLNIMSDKKVKFDAGVFNNLIKLLAPFYVNQKKQLENEFLRSVYQDIMEMPETQGIGNSYDQIKNHVVLTINNEKWSVADLKKEIDKHPLVLRKVNIKKKFGARLMVAIVDLIRDKYLTDEAYKRGYNKNEIVTHYEQSWFDASIALFQRNKYLDTAGLDSSNSKSIFDEYLNPYFKELFKKYSGKIEINVEEYNKISLTRTDMLSTQANVPYPIYVPAFPQLTTYSRLNYGNTMGVSKNAE